MIEDSILHDDCIEITLNKISREPVKRVLDQKDVDIMLAKHILWLNDAGGEQADFSNCRLEHLHLSGKNMLNVILDDAEIIGCDLENAEMCFSACNNTRFETCIMKKITAEECDFKMQPLIIAILNEQDLCILILKMQNFFQQKCVMPSCQTAVLKICKVRTRTYHRPI